jgi:hypothetical protein
MRAKCRLGRRGHGYVRRPLRTRLPVRRLPATHARRRFAGRRHGGAPPTEIAQQRLSCCELTCLVVGGMLAQRRSRGLGRVDGHGADDLKQRSPAGVTASPAAR